MHELMKLAHEFLQCFCLGNKTNQALLHKDLDLFLTPSVSIPMYLLDTSTLVLAETYPSITWNLPKYYRLKLIWVLPETYPSITWDLSEY